MERLIASEASNDEVIGHWSETSDGGTRARGDEKLQRCGVACYNIRYNTRRRCGPTAGRLLADHRSASCVPRIRRPDRIIQTVAAPPGK